MMMMMMMMMLMMMMVIILIIIIRNILYMKHYNNTQPNLIIHYISHSIPSLPYIHTRTPTYTVSQPQSRSLSILIFWILFTVYVFTVYVAVFNNSLVSGVFPSVYKSALVKPLLKKMSLDPDDLKNYRSVSNLSLSLIHI